jgi:4-hydroxy-2-oxoglutarate aldolase
MLERYVAVQKANPRFTVLTGHGPTFASALSLGVRGGILAVALFTGDITPRIFAAHRAGDAALASELQGLITPCGKEVVGTHGVAGVKAALDFVGLDGGPLRSPLAALGEAQRKAVAALVPRATTVHERPAGAR